MFVNDTNRCNVYFVYISIVLFVQDQVYLYYINKLNTKIKFYFLLFIVPRLFSRLC